MKFKILFVSIFFLWTSLYVCYVFSFLKNKGNSEETSAVDKKLSDENYESIMNFLKAENSTIEELSSYKEIGIDELRNGSVNRGIKILKEVEKQTDKEDPEITAWLASAHSMLANTVNSGVEKIKYVDEATQELIDIYDKTDNLVSKYIVIQTFLAFPEFFYDQKEQALNYLDDMVKDYFQYKKYTITDSRFEQVEKLNTYELLEDCINIAMETKGWKKKEKKQLNKIYKALQDGKK